MTARMATALALLAAAAGGCGASAEEEFRTQHLAPVEQRIEQHRAEITAVLQATQARDRADAQRLRRRVAALSTTVADAAALEPPESVAVGYQRHVRALEALVRDLRTLAGALEAGRRAPLAQAGRRTAGAVDSVVRTREALETALAREQ